MKKIIKVVVIIVVVIFIFFAPIIFFKSSGVCFDEPCTSTYAVTSSVFKIIMHKIQPDNYKWMVNYIN